SLLPVVVFVAWALLAQGMAFAWHRRHDLPSGGSPVEVVQAWLREAWAFVVVGSWHVTGWGRDGLIRPIGEVTGRPVLLVHGFTQNGTNWWGLRRRLRACGHASVAVSLGRPLRSVRAHA